MFQEALTFYDKRKEERCPSNKRLRISRIIVSATEQQSSSHHLRRLASLWVCSNVDMHM